MQATSTCNHLIRVMLRPYGRLGIESGSKIRILEMNYLELPKIDLHCHLDGSLRPQTVIDLAKV